MTTEKFFENLEKIKQMRRSIEKIAHKDEAEEFKLNHLYELESDYEMILEKMEQPYKDVLVMHYLRGLQFKVIAAKMHYAPSSITKIHKKALQILQDKIEDWE